VTVDQADQFQVFDCQKCKIKTCALCQKDWKDHAGKKCNEVWIQRASSLPCGVSLMPRMVALSQVEDDTNTSARKRVEEKMTRSMLRTCAACNLPFQKEEDTCNKMTCPSCKAFTCNCCRALIVAESNKQAYVFIAHSQWGAACVVTCCDSVQFSMRVCVCVYFVGIGHCFAI
jgi:hypothetical protein